LRPGFTDCHVHLCLDGSADPVTNCMSESVTITGLKAAKFALQTLAAGVTTVPAVRCAKPSARRRIPN
jgi:imidazolonepropionase-like amidohydrolase